MKVELDWDQVEPLVIEALTDDYNALRSKATPPMFSRDPVKEKAEVAALRGAFKRVLSYYGKAVK